MEKFTTLTAVAAPLRLANIDTDMLAPGESMKTVSKTGLAPYLFGDMRYHPDGSEDPDFVLNKPAYRKAQILVAGPNFGCGSSREHAVWCLRDFGIRCVVAPSFADIFFLNCLRNGILLVTLPKDQVELLLTDAEKGANATLTVDLLEQRIARPNGETLDFAVDPFRKHYLTNGLDDTQVVDRMARSIGAFEERQRAARPWMWGG
jgi:3-isopropylmalate/(R)-2-methylmalate dehydratase small subunit